MAWDDTKIDDDGASAAGRLLATEYNALVSAIKERLLKSMYNANTIITADIEDTPAALTIGEQTLVGRITGGLITALTPAQIRTLIGVLDEDAMTSDSDTNLATQQSIKKYVDDSVVGTITYVGGYDAATNTPDLDVSPSGVLLGDMYIVTAAGTFFTTAVVIGDALIANTVGATLEYHWDIVGQYVFAASEVPNTPAGTISATNVQDAINELDGDITAHVSDTSDAHDASAISNIPAGTVAATTVQAAIDELDTEKSLIANITDMDKQSFTNLLKNGDFESWSLGASNVPDGWNVSGAGAVIAREATIKKIKTYSSKVTRVDNDCTLYQEISDYTRYQNREVTLGCWVYSTDPLHEVGIAIQDSAGYSTTIYHTGDSSWQWLTVTKTIDNAATSMKVHCKLDGTNGSGYYDGAILVEGSVCPASSPHPTDQIPIVLTSAPTDAGANGETRWYAIAGAGGARRLYMSNGTDWKYQAIAT